MDSTKQTGWIDGQWGSTSQLKIAINDRGLNFSDGIFETIYCENGKPQLLIEHLTRWQQAAFNLGMALPPNQERVEPLIQQGLQKAGALQSTASVRLNWSRGSNQKRGIDISQDVKIDHHFWIEVNHINLCFKPISTIISQNEKRNSESLLNQFKTLNYLQSIEARREANLAGYDDSLLASTTGEICCGTTANIIVKRNNQLLTPRLESGCLPGIMREKALQKGLIKEAKLSTKPEINDEWLLLNSLGAHPISKIDKRSIKIFNKAEHFWRSLINNKG